MPRLTWPGQALLGVAQWSCQGLTAWTMHQSRCGSIGLRMFCGGPLASCCRVLGTENARRWCIDKVLKSGCVHVFFGHHASEFAEFADVFIRKSSVGHVWTHPQNLFSFEEVDICIIHLGLAFWSSTKVENSHRFKARLAQWLATHTINIQRLRASSSHPLRISTYDYIIKVRQQRILAIVITLR